MGMVALRRGIGSAYFVNCGRYGDVSRFAQEQGVSRQWVYREAKQVTAIVESTQTQQELERLRSEIAALRATVTRQQQRLSLAVVLDKAKQTEVSCVGRAWGDARMRPGSRRERCWRFSMSLRSRWCAMVQATRFTSAIRCCWWWSRMAWA